MSDPVVKRLVCLANSRKPSGRCVAGKELGARGPLRWIRPVSAREQGEVSEYERQYEDGSDPRVLDITNVPLIDPRPKYYQSENWLLHPDFYWVKAGRIGWTDLQHLADPVEPLWIDGHKTYNGLNDEIPLAATADLTSSLRLIHVSSVTLAVFKPGAAFGNPKRRVQGRFQHSGREYRLWVSDPIYEREYLAKSDGEYVVGDSFLTISLAEPHKGFVYKVIAAIIERVRIVTP